MKYRDYTLQWGAVRPHIAVTTSFESFYSQSSPRLAVGSFLTKKTEEEA
jgi:hypothetical protein